MLGVVPSTATVLPLFGFILQEVFSFLPQWEGNIAMPSTSNLRQGQEDGSRSKSGRSWSEMIYSISINNKEVLSVKNSKPPQFENVKVFAGSPWYTPVDGYIRNLLIEQKGKGRCSLRYKHRVHYFWTRNQTGIVLMFI